MSKNKFLSFSDLTRPNAEIKKVARQFTGSKREVVKKIINWIGKNLGRKKFRKESFRKRNVREIIKSGYLRNCSDQALVFITLARLNMIPTKYVYLLEGRRIKESECHSSGGHTIARCFLDGWEYIDPSPKALYGNFLGKKIDIPFKRWTLWHEGKNWKELGLDSWKRMKEIAKERPAMAEIKIPDEIFDWIHKKSKEKASAADLLRKILKKGFKEIKKA